MPATSLNTGVLGEASSSSGMIKPSLKSMVFGPAAPEGPMITVIPSLVRQVMNFIHTIPSPVFLRTLNLLDIDDSTIIPSYINDFSILIHLVSISSPQLVEGNESLEKLARDYNLLDESDDDDEDILMGTEDEIEEENVEKEEVVGDGNTDLVPQAWAKRS